MKSGTQRFSGRAAICASAVIFICGCFGSSVAKPKTVKVSGSVTYQGQPVTDATVSFWAEGAPQAATGITDKEGKFTLSTFDPGDGAVVGDHVITVTKGEAKAAASSGPNMQLMQNPAQMAEMSQKRQAAPETTSKSLVPVQYGDKRTSPLKHTVTAEGPNQFPLQLVD